jgi:hypothetical protein
MGIADGHSATGLDCRVGGTGVPRLGAGEGDGPEETGGGAVQRPTHEKAGERR